MDFGDWVVNIIVVIIVGVFLWLWLGPTLYRSLADAGVSKFHHFLDDLVGPQDEYQYFTLGHIVWSETSVSEIEKLIRSDSSALVPGEGARPNIPRFLLHVNEVEKRVYFAPTNESSFDWDSIPHYEGYVKTASE